MKFPNVLDRFCRVAAQFARRFSARDLNLAPGMCDATRADRERPVPAIYFHRSLSLSLARALTPHSETLRTIGHQRLVVARPLFSTNSPVAGTVAILGPVVLFFSRRLSPRSFVVFRVRSFFFLAAAAASTL